jgi:hypothetical protein
MTNIENIFKNIIDAAQKNDLMTIRQIIKSGFDVSTTNKYGESILDEVISDLSDGGELQTHRLEVVRLLLELGANPNQRDTDGMGSLTSAMLVMDTEMLRLLLEAGALPNEFSGTSISETLYEWAAFDYVYEVWDINKIPDLENQVVPDDEDEWLNWIDGIAVKYGRRRPDHLFLLRQYGARLKSELN